MADKKSSAWTSLPMQMMLGLVLGVIVGAFTNPEFAQTWFRPLGDLFIRLIRMVVVPLVFATLVAGAAGISDVSKLGRVAVRTLVLFMVTSAISVVFGLVIANLIDPGVGVTLSTEGLKAAQVNAPSFVKTLLEIVPINPMEAFAKGSILQIIFFAIMFGFCLNAMGEKGRAMYEFFDVMGHVMIRMTNIVMRYAPIGVFGLMAAVVAQHGIAVLLPLGKLILSSFIATSLLIIIIYIPWVKFWIRIPLGQYFKGIFEPWLIAFTTCSSAAAMASNLVASRRLGATNAIASFAVPLGNTINMNGTTAMHMIAITFIATAAGIDITPSTLVMAAFLSICTAMGCPAIPVAGTTMVYVIMSGLGMTSELCMIGYSLVLAMNYLPGMAVITLNVIGDAATNVIVNFKEGVLNKEMYNKMD